MIRGIALAVLFTASSALAADAQQAADTLGGTSADRAAPTSERELLGVPVDSLGTDGAQDLEAALERIGERLGALADRVANDPELRRSALRTAESLLDVTEVVVARQSELLIEMLRKASEEIAETARRSEAAPADGGEGQPVVR